jgi:hypothetical protein
MRRQVLTTLLVMFAGVTLGQPDSQKCAEFDFCTKYREIEFSHLSSDERQVEYYLQYLSFSSPLQGHLQLNKDTTGTAATDLDIEINFYRKGIVRIAISEQGRESPRFKISDSGIGVEQS